MTAVSFYGSIMYRSSSFPEAWQAARMIVEQRKCRSRHRMIHRERLWGRCRFKVCCPSMVCRSWVSSRTDMVCPDTRSVVYALRSRREGCESARVNMARSLPGSQDDKSSNSQATAMPLGFSQPVTQRPSKPPSSEHCCKLGNSS